MARRMNPSSWLVAALLLLCVENLAAQSSVTTLKAPCDGFRPRVVLDADGVLHLVQSSHAARGDLFYLCQEPGQEEFSSPIRVNLTPGIVAGFDMAVGKNGRVHVLIRTNPKYLKLMMPDKAKLTFFDLKYMLYTRLNDEGTAFEAERNLAGHTIGFEGMGTILAKGDQVFAFWHGQTEPKYNESTRLIYRVVSTDGGRTFSQPEAAKTDVVGACQCCAMAGLWDAQGDIALALRSSSGLPDGRTKDSYVLVSKDQGKTFSGTLLDPWINAGCPGSVGALASGPSGLFTGWRTRTKVHFARVADEIATISPVAGATTRVPVLVCNDKGEVLFMWGTTGGPKVKGGGHLVWQQFDRDGKALNKKQSLKNGVASRWGAATAFARPGGDFVILYDGDGE